MSKILSNVPKAFYEALILLILLCLVSEVLEGCGSKEVDPETGNTVEVGSFINVPGREDEDLVYHKTSKTVYVLEIDSPRCDWSTGYCALYRDKGTFWKYDEKNKKIIPEDTNGTYLTRVDYDELIKASKESEIDVYDILLEYSERQEINAQQKKELIEMLEETEYEMTENYRRELILKIMDM